MCAILQLVSAPSNVFHYACVTVCALVYVYVCVSVSVCACICIYIYVYVYVYEYVCMCVCICVLVGVCESRKHKVSFYLSTKGHFRYFKVQLDS